MFDKPLEMPTLLVKGALEALKVEVKVEDEDANEGEAEAVVTLPGDDADAAASQGKSGGRQWE